MIGHLCAHGMENRIVFDEAARTDGVLRWPFTKLSRMEGERGKIENELEDERFLQAFIAKRGKKTLEQNPYTKIYAQAAERQFSRSHGAPDSRSSSIHSFFPRCNTGTR